MIDFSRQMAYNIASKALLLLVPEGDLLKYSSAIISVIQWENDESLKKRESAL